MEGGYILTYDLPAERTASQLGGLRTSRKPVNAPRGELLLAIRGQDLVPRNDGGKPHNYRLARDTTITLRAAEEEVAPLDWRDYSLLEAIKSAHSQFDTFISTDRMEWGLSLKEGSEVFVVVNLEEDHHSWLRSRAVVRWAGDLGGGTVFGVEIMDKAHRGHGTTDGTYTAKLYFGISRKRYFACANGCGMFVALDKLSRDREGINLAAPPPSGQQYGGRGPNQHEDQQEPSRPVTRSAAAALREAQKSGGQSQQPVKKAQVAVGSKEKRTVAQFRKKDRVVVYTEKGTAVHGTVEWTGRYNHPELTGAFVVGVETDVSLLKDDFPDAVPDVSGVIHPGRGRGEVFLLESYVTLESKAAQAAAEKFEAQRSRGQSQQPEGDPAPLGLGDSWECWYCLKLLPSSYSFCDTCGRDRDRDDTPVGEIPRGTAAVPGAASTQSLQVKISTLELQLAEAETAKQKQLDKKEQAILELQLHLQSQLDQKQQTVLDLQRQASDLRRQSSETERNLRGQMNEERQRYRSEIETVRYELARLQRQSSSREVEVWNVPRGDVKIDKEIGVGGWGSVSKGTFHGRAVAVKQLHPDIISSDNVSRLRREVCLMANVRHPNILLFIAAVFDEAVDQLRPPLIILELLDVDLRKAYKANMVGPRNYISIFHDVACALNYLHCLREPIIHRDLSAPNVLLEAMPNNHWKAKVSDFGSANLARLAQTAAEGAIIYSAPESLPKEIRGPYAPDFPQTTKIDIYSYGVLLCEVMTRTLPKELGPLITELKRWPSIHTLAITCTSYNPDDRPTIASILTELHKLGQ